MKEKFDELSVACSKITTQRYSTSFSLGIHFLGKELRGPFYSIYGFVRLADEIVDSFHRYDKAYLLAKFKQDCFESIELGISLNPVLNAFQQVVNTYAMDQQLIGLFLKSMEMDLGNTAYDRLEYDEYILGSAQVVGLMCLCVFTGGNAELYRRLSMPAMKLGSAFQKVNFLRDINADHTGLGRTYFPGVNPDEFSEQEKKLIEVEIEQEFGEALEGIRRLPPPARRGVYLAYIYYRQLFYKIKKIRAERILSERVRVSNSRKLILLFDSLIRYQLNLL